MLYKFDLQTRLHTYEKYLPELRANSAERIKENKNYQEFLKSLKESEDTDIEDETQEQKRRADFQLEETYNIMRDLLYFQKP